MQPMTGFTRKYAIMEELDGGFGEGGKPEAFVRLDSWEGRITASLHAKGLKQGPYRYMLYLIFVQDNQLTALPAGPVGAAYPNNTGVIEIDADTLRRRGIRPESIRYAAIAAENGDKKWVPLFSSFDKSFKWDEVIRQALYRKPEAERSEKASAGEKSVEQPQGAAMNEPPRKAEGGAGPAEDRKPMPDARPGKCDCEKLETLIKSNFEPCIPFKGGNRDYTWYTVNDLAKLSNIMFMAGVNVPVFANPKILVGLFRYKHILAGIYKGANNSQYFVIGIPAKNETDNRPFENACRWVGLRDSDIRDMGGYWLIYVSLRSGEIVV
jgi:hypothetical protein